MASLKVQQKREKIRSEILAKASPMIASGEYNDMTIRELCDRLEITTGMFYRYFKTKDDLLAFYSIEKGRYLYGQAKQGMTGKTLSENLLTVCMLNIESSKEIGPSSILVHLNVDNPDCDCKVQRKEFLQMVRAAYEASFPGGEYTEDALIQNAEALLVLMKGLTFEWYSRQDDPGFDITELSERLLRQVISSLDLPDERE